MKITFPAMQGRIGKRDYYVAMIKLNIIPKIFSFHDWAELPPEQRAQRVLQRARIPEITQYIVDNEDGYLFSSLTASFDGEPSFKPSTESTEMGLLELPLESQFVINDGQHRMAAIIEAMKQNPTLGSETISVVFFPFEDLDRMQQMFSDLNRTVKVTSKSLNILYDHRDLLAQIVLEAAEKVPVFKKMVDKDRVSLPLRSPKLFTLSAIYDATQQLVGEVTHENQIDEKTKITLDYWESVGANIPQWKQILEGYLRPSELRSEYVNSHAVVLWGLGAMGKLLLQEYPTEWVSRLQDLSKIDWRRINKEWDGICMQGSEIVNRRQSKSNTAAFLKNKMGLPLTPSEEKFLKPVPHGSLSTEEKAKREEFAEESIRILKIDYPDDLTHTKILEGWVGDDNAWSWNDLVYAVHKYALKYYGSFEALKKETHSNISKGPLTERGYRYYPDIGISIQGEDSNDSWEKALYLARKIKVSRIEVAFEWRNKKGAVHPGQKGRLFWRPNDKIMN